MMRVGFTGTRNGLTPPQREALRGVLRALAPTHLHHGDCRGADSAAHDEVRALGVAVEVHPPLPTTLRAWRSVRDGEVMHERAHYLARDAAIVAATALLVACPKEETGEGHGGTWWTIRRARAFGRRVVIVRPSGRVEDGDG